MEERTNSLVPGHRTGLIRRGRRPGGPKLTGDLLGDGRLNIRSFESGDKQGVESICFNHFRSLCLAAVRYYIAEHLQDLCFLIVVSFCFMKLTHLILIVLLFNTYLFLKSRWEMESYIRRDCQDLREVSKTYLSPNDTACHFWVAEVVEANPTNPDTSSTTTSTTTSTNTSTANLINTSSTTATPSTSKSGALVGCIGLVPSRENSSVAKVVRLVVDSSHRRMRIGSRLLLQLEHYAKDEGYESVRIYTNTLNPSHMKFVRQHGYTVVQTIRRGLMRGDLVTWHKRLVTTPPGIPTDNTELNSDENVVDFQIRSAAQHVMD